MDGSLSDNCVKHIEYAEKKCIFRGGFFDAQALIQKISLTA